MWCFPLFYTMAAKKSDLGEEELTTEELNKLGARIRSLRIAKGYANYEKFANEKNLNRSQYWRYEKGMDLRFSSLVQVLRALEVTYQEFFSEGF